MNLVRAADRLGGAAASPPGLLLDRLRAETRPEHDAIERDLGWERRVSTHTGYRDLLARFYGFHAVWEDEAAALIADESFFNPRRKLHLLAADLGHLGLAASDLERLPCARAALPMRDRFDALGAMYVLEGSTLGGQIIARRIVEGLGLSADRGCSFYRAYGPKTGAMWRDFRGTLSRTPAHGHDAIVHSASRTFRALRCWLCAETALDAEIGLTDVGMVEDLPGRA